MSWFKVCFGELVRFFIVGSNIFLGLFCSGELVGFFIVGSNIFSRFVLGNW